MLKPFRIKDLLDPALDEQPGPSCLGVKDSEGNSRTDLHAAGQEDDKPSECHTYDGIVEISRTEYDATISQIPDSKLRYTDEDDGETVTVGSSFELAQRLDETPAESTSPLGLSPFGQLETTPMHLFDIGKSSTSIKTWKAFETRTSLQKCQPSVSCLSDIPEKLPSVATSSSSIFTPKLNPTNIIDPRQHWFEACNPPKPPTKDKTEMPEGKHSPQELNRDNVKTNSMRSCGSLTDEGKKQAQAAGAKFRKSRNMWQGSRPPSLTPVGAQNFWSSYQVSPPVKDDKDLTEREPRSQESPIEEQPQSFLAAFEAELSKLVEQNPDSENSVETETAQTTIEPAITPAPKIEPPTSHQIPQTQPIPMATEIVGKHVQALLGSIGHLTSELRVRLPEVERRILSAQQHMPLQIQTTAQETLNTMRSHVQTFAKAALNAAQATQEAAAQSQHAQMLAAAQTEGLRNLASELAETGRTMFTALEVGISADCHNVNEASSLDSQSASGLNITPPSMEGLTPKSNDNLCATLPNQATDSPAKPYSRSHTTPETVTSPSSTLFIGGLGPSTAEETIRKTLVDYGFLGDVKLPTDAVTGKHAGFGYIYFPCHYAATGALHALRGGSIDGHTINLEYSQETPSDNTHNITPTAESLSNSDISNLPSSSTRNIQLLQSWALDQPANKTRQKHCPPVTSDVTSDENPHAAKIRRAKSLGSWSSSQRGNDARRAVIPPLHPVRVGYRGVRRQSAHDNSTSRRSDLYRLDSPNPEMTTLPIVEDIDRDFWARYPPLSTLHRHPTPSTASVSRIEPERALDPRHFTKIRVPDLLQPESELTKQASIRDAPTYKTRGKGPLPPAVPDKVPGAWPKERNAPGRSSTAGPPRPMKEARIQDNRKVGSPAPLNNELSNESDSPHSFISPVEPHTFPGPPMEYPYNAPGSFPSETLRTKYSTPHCDSSPQGLARTKLQDVNCCIRNLTSLGYATGRNRDRSRLRVYAEAAGGNLNEAIEIIEEERKAYEQRYSHE
ncbi:predicted protein [Uncinocarpus reesii 1704]|uniref:RRM domain-containing protein n=1 Tax=Uncinocarpus reesii (strain UAMH 1704) TaxID=336963 RepID=C4JWA6_UNCRE|nr:uncharacterized protein UREG_06848 [Uncinocarpus reesii 1704]EEP81983.1 predicted protein [Uncinocarpus reesii 1704]